MKTTLTALLAICLCLPLMGNDAAKKNFEETKAAAEKGDMIAQHSLGWCYYKGAGVPKDAKEAVRWIRKAAEQGYVMAQFNLGDMYKDGDGVLKDDVTAYAWYNIAEANFNRLAKLYKGMLANKMTSNQIAKAQEFFKEMVKKNPKLINK